MLRLPMWDEKFAHTSIEILSREFITLFESFACLQPPLPDTLVHAYIHATLSGSLETIRRQHRMARVSGRICPEDLMRRDALLVAIESLVEDRQAATRSVCQCPTFSEQLTRGFDLRTAAARCL